VRCSGSDTCSRRSAVTTRPWRATTRASRCGPTSAKPTGAWPNLKTYRFDDETVSEMEKRVAGGGLSTQVRGQLPVRARQGLRGPRRFRASAGSYYRAATTSSAQHRPTTRCRPRS
jgi:hypothetical protein